MSLENIAQLETTPLNAAETSLNAAETMNGTTVAPNSLWISEDYRLIEQLGAGAMGTVWRARDERLGRIVALKLVHTDGLDEKDVDRVHREAKLTASVEHANVVTVHDTGTTEAGDFYMVMELLDGRDLLSLTQDSQPRSAEETVQLLLPILAGMKAAHRVNILHRDIKPANVFVAEVDGKLVPKLVDFGVALRSDLPSSHRLTQDGHLLGTPLYMAPEQLKGAANVGESTDIWSFSIVLYEALTGEVPFEGSNLTALFFNILNKELPALPAHLGNSDLNDIVQKGAAKNAEDRWQSADEMAQALARWLSSRGVDTDVSGDSLSKWLEAENPISWQPSRRSARPTLPSLAEWQRVASSGIRRISEHGKRQLTLAVGVPLVIFGAQAWATGEPVPPDFTGAADIAAAQQQLTEPLAQQAKTTSNDTAPGKDPAVDSKGAKLGLAAENRVATSRQHMPSVNARNDSALRQTSGAPRADKKTVDTKPVDPYWGF